MIRLPALGVALVATLVLAPPAQAAFGLLDSFGTKGSGDGQFRHPSDLALDSAGNVYVADQDNHRILKLAPDGRLLSKFGSGSLEERQTAPGAFDDPSGVAVDPAGDMWVIESDNKRVQKLAPDGSHLLTFGGDAGFADPQQLALAPNGDVFVSDLSGMVFRFAADGTLLGTLGEGRLETPGGIAVDRAGNVLVADRDQFRVDVFSPGGDLLRTMSRPLSRGALYARDVALDASANVWVLVDGDPLVKFSPSGTLLTTVSESLRPGDKPAYRALGIVAEAGGRVLVADTQVGRILRYGEGGRVQGGSGAALISLGLSPRVPCSPPRAVDRAAGRHQGDVCACVAGARALRCSACGARQVPAAARSLHPPRLEWNQSVPLLGPRARPAAATGALPARRDDPRRGCPQANPLPHRALSPSAKTRRGECYGAAQQDPIAEFPSAWRPGNGGPI